MTKYIIGVLGLLLALAVGLALMYRGNAANAKREETAQKAIADAATARANDLQNVLDKERKAASQMAGIGKTLEDKKDEAETVPSIILDDLNADRLRLRKQWAGCQADLSEAAATARERNEETQRRREAAGRIVRIGRDSDDQLEACQTTVKFYEDFYAQ